MSMKRPSSTTALDLYREQLREAPTCEQCGYTDEGGVWRTGYRDRQLVYRHTCPRCGAVDSRTFRFAADE